MDIVSIRPQEARVFLQQRGSLKDFAFAYSMFYTDEYGHPGDVDADGRLDLVYVDPRNGVMLLRGK